MFACQDCSKVYNNNESLRKHCYRHHSVTQKPPPKTVKCEKCDYCGTSEEAYRKHRKRAHQEATEATGKDGYTCSVCAQQLPSIKAYVKHHSNVHENAKAVIEEKIFANETEFMAWKNSLRADNCVEFVTQYTWSTTTSKAKMMLCNRSGFCRRSGSGLRAPKISIRSEKDCTAFLTVHIYNDGRVKVEYCMEHVGHSLEMARLRMSEEEKAEISRYLEDGHETTWIIEKIRDKNSGNRLMYVTAQAVDYLRSCLHIDSGRLHTNDMASVAEAVRLDGVVDENDENAAPAWRNYFSYSPASDSSGTSFSLGLQTQEQAEWLKEFGNKGVCLDATHNSTRYSFKLITMMVLDNRQKGRPVAHFFCKEENEANLITFFNGVKDRCDIPLMPEVIMTDDAIQYWTAWIKVFGEQSTRKLLCSWHIAKNWGMKAKDLIVDANIRKEVLTSLHKLARLPDEASFRQHLAELLTRMDVARCEDFKKYFFDNYIKKEDRLMSWAPFNRRRSVVNTNMALERFHGKLKSHILKKSENRRLDFVLYGLEKFCRNLVRDVIVQDTLKTRHRQYRLYQTHKSHRKAMATYAQTQFEGIECTDQEGVYRVKSLTRPNLFHFVRQIKKCSCPYE
uniref:C2H2-type domain-containing protein n=1 Tax=Plectus sambesii TaxID=2011161 RepID=A0A914X4X2_9BILA